jgi:hypothetical protein
MAWLISLMAVENLQKYEMKAGASISWREEMANESYVANIMAD